jgi:hypothetical protein
MTTLTINLPDDLAEQVQGRGISQQRLENVVIFLVQEFLREFDETLPDNKMPPAVIEPIWTDSQAFARRVITKNRELFEELAQL